jgi:hypothetical protein
MTGLIIAITAIALVLLVLVSRRKPHAAESHTAHSPLSTRAAGMGRSAGKYPGVSINAAPRCCEGAASIDGVRFLPDEAPALPLAGCTLKQCKCTYMHHADRRSGTHDRRRLLGQKKDYVLFFGDEDQREGRGRRASDWEEAYKNSDYLSY